MTEVKLTGPTYWTGDGVEHKSDLSQYKVGEIHCVWAGAPGTGRWVGRITRVDETGAWAEEIENTIRELEPWEVE